LRLAKSSAFITVIDLARNGDFRTKHESLYVICNLLTTAEPSLVFDMYPQLLEILLRNLHVSKNNNKLILT